jgi:Tol biopolymer transport system component
MAAPPLHAEWPPLAVSPDGRRLAYVVRAGAGAQILVRDLDALTARVIPGTDNGFAPFFSPDGEHLGFFTSDSLMRVALAAVARAADERITRSRGAGLTTADLLRAPNPAASSASLLTAASLSR